jgi:hypothetical protein
MPPKTAHSYRVTGGMAVLASLSTAVPETRDMPGPIFTISCKGLADIREVVE